MEHRTGTPTGIQIVAADHPSLVGDIDDFLERLQREQRYFGPSARLNPKPSRSLIEDLRVRSGFKMAAVECGRIVGLARVDGGGDLKIAVATEHRGRGVGTRLGRAMTERARDLHYRRLVLRSTRRSRAARRIGEELGAVVVEVGRGRTEIIMDLLGAERTA
jgi:GNAT superfamily N-acetyltransferase